MVDNIYSVPSYQSLIAVDGIRSKPSWLKNIKLKTQENSFLDVDFNSHKNRDFILENSERYLNKLSTLVDLYIDTSVQYSYLPIDNYDLQVLGAYEDVNGLLHLGSDYYDMETVLQKLISDYLIQFGGAIDANELMLQLCSLKKIQEDSDITIQNIAFNYKQTRKELLQTWVDVFRQYQFTDSSSILIKKMNELIVNRENNFLGPSNEFDLSRDNEKFDKREVLLAKRIVSVLTELLRITCLRKWFLEVFW